MTRYNMTAFVAQTSGPSYAFGQRAIVPVEANQATGHLRVTIPADIPENAIVTKADVVLELAGGYTGARAFTLQRQSARSDNTITWNTRPGVVGAVVATTVTDPAAGTKVVFTAAALLNDVQNFVAGAVDNFGWRLSTTSTSRSYFDGSTAAAGVPYLDLEWVMPGEPPTDLAPAGRIATGNPTLTFLMPEASTHIQVQVSTVDDFATTVYDSGEVAATGGGVFELTGYTIPNNATRYWRVRTRAGGVLSDWAEAEVVRTDFAPLAITTPGANTGDPTPEITWTFTGQTAWQAQLFDATAGRLLADSGRTAGTTQSWTPPAGLRGEGSAKTIVRAWDAQVDRVPTVGVPDYAQAEHTFTVNAAGTDTGLQDLTATQRAATPIVDLAWSIPTPLAAGKKIQVIRNGQYLGDPLPPTTTQYADRTAPRNVNLLYKVAVVSASGDVSSFGPTDLIYPRSKGVWLLDPDVDFAEIGAAVILGKDSGAPEMPEQSLVHPVNGRAPVRRRIGLVPPTGVFSGVVMTALGVTAEETYSNLMLWKPRDLSTVYRLVLGNWNIPVTVGDIYAFPTTDSGDDTQYLAGFGWWQTDEELPWE